MLSRLKAALDAGRNAMDAADTPPAPAAATAEVVALLVLDPVSDAAATLAARHVARVSANGGRALLVLNPLSEPDLARRDALCEFLPLPEDLARTTGDRPDVVERYVLARFRLMLDKWGVRECRWHGDAARDLVTRWERLADPTVRPVSFVPAEAD
jgi:hypothetical protein